MPGTLQVRVFDRDQTVFSQDFNGPVELGRQNDGNEQLYSARQLPGGRWRAVIARLDEDTLSRRHVLLEPLDGGRVKLTNLSAKVPVRLGTTDLPAQGSCELSMPTTLFIGRRSVRVQAPDRREPSLRGLPLSLAPPGQMSVMASRSIAASRSIGGGSRFPTIVAGDKVDPEELMRWLQMTMGVIQAAASSSDFIQKAAQAVVDIVGCDTGRVLLLEHGEWRPVEVRSAPGVNVDPRWRPSRNVLDRVRQEKRTFWQGPRDPWEDEVAESLIGVEVVVAAPVLDGNGEVIGAVYGDCHEEGLNPNKARITELEAMLVELLAGGVATGLARVEQEKHAVESRVQFEQFFTKELSRELALQPDLLKGRDSEVSILFCDIRSFSRISEKLGPARTVEWIGEVMATLSECVLAHKGVLVDYIGDELMAMWGAPQEQPDHARLACLAALDMLARIPELNTRWQETLGKPMDLGIGINSGQARVGNMGSRQKFKYGPLGHTVNLASRVQGATKYLRCRLLVTRFTQAQLGEDFDTRRLCKVRVVNIKEPVDLYEVAAHPPPAWHDLKVRYEQALDEFERGDFRSAARMLGPLLGEHADDGPSLVLSSRTLNSLVVEPADFDPVWELPGK